jgi:hypothetical protein
MVRLISTFILTKKEIITALEQLAQSNRLIVDTDIEPSHEEEVDSKNHIQGYVISENGPFVHLLLSNDIRRRFIKTHNVLQTKTR